MRVFIRSVLAASLAILVVGGGFVAAHPPEEPEEEVPDETLRTLVIGAASKQAQAQTAQNGTGSSSSYNRPQDAGLKLSFDPAASASPTRTYGFQNGVRVLGCLSPCQSPPVKGAATLANASEDLQLQWEDSVVGQISYAWTYRSNTPPVPPNSQPYVVLQFHLSVGGESYGSQSLYAKGTQGRMTVPLEFWREASCDERGNGSYHHEDCYDNFTASEELWAHDVSLTVHIQRMDYQYVTLGDLLTLSVDTSGQSFLLVHELPPPPPEPEVVEEAALSDDGAVEVEWQDADGDGEEELDEVRFVPGPGLFGVAAALGGLAWLRRRRVP